MTVSAVDYHTAGEPFRIVPAPSVALPGTSVADRRAQVIDDPAAQDLRRLLCFEPRGHADMYGGFITPPDDSGAHFGVLFWHKDGFSTACGHGTIALGVWAVESGLVPADPSGTTDVVIDVPSGRVLARVTSGTPPCVDFIGVPSRATALDVAVQTSMGPVMVDLGFGGAIYAHLDARTIGLAVQPEHITSLIAIGREVKAALAGTEFARHPDDDRLSGIYGVILYEDEGLVDGILRQRNVTVFADGQVDRSPCGSGTASRLAVLAARGRLSPGQCLEHVSIVGSIFEGRFDSADGEEIRPIVRGTAHRTGVHEFVLDPADELGLGFVLR